MKSKHPPPASSTAGLRRALLGHYDLHRRHLPWRGEHDPYRILVSEVMLQQTRVETVLDYYETWVERFPDLASLAAADLDEVLEAWEGLGYYRRARNLHRAAQVVCDRMERSLPGSYAELRELPGVGEYTAGAVASIAFGEVVPAPDGNVRRVLARLFDEPEPDPAWIRETAAALVDGKRPGDWNQALMDLGATICTPRGPACERCPVVEWCRSRAAGTERERPAAKPRKAPRKAVFASVVLVRGRRALMTRRPPEGLLGGMWAFPEREVGDAQRAVAAARSVAAELVSESVGAPEPLTPCDHRFTHVDATYLPFLVAVETDGTAHSPTAADAQRWVQLDRPVGLPLPVAQRRILESARDRLGAVRPTPSSPGS